MLNGNTCDFVTFFSIFQISFVFILRLHYTFFSVHRQSQHFSMSHTPTKKSNKNKSKVIENQLSASKVQNTPMSIKSHVLIEINTHTLTLAVRVGGGPLRRKVKPGMVIGGLGPEPKTGGSWPSGQGPASAECEVASAARPPSSSSCDVALIEVAGKI